MEPIRAIVVGAGHRSLVYASYAKSHPDEMKIVGVADLQEYRRRYFAELFGLPDESLFESAEELASAPRLADAIINGTMDHQHVSTAVPLLESGYDMLLEKPFATSEDEMWRLVRTASEHKNTVAICHVLRYAPFMQAIKREITNGTIGEIINIQTIEHVSYHHMAVGFVRGKWNSKERSHSSMLMAKCCHDLDLLMWLKSGVPPIRVSSFGNNMQFRPEKAPSGAGNKCLVDCAIESECPYSARKHYLDHPKRWAFYVWDALEEIDEPTDDDRENLLRSDSPYGRCVWRSENDVVDHQSLVIEYADGATATHNMIGGTSRPARAIRVIGTKGEIEGVLEESKFVIRHIDTRPGYEYSERTVDLDLAGDMHGAFGGHAGGDERLVADFLKLLRRGETSLSSTTLNDSVYGHLTGFRADRAMEQCNVQEIPQVEEVYR